MTHLTGIIAYPITPFTPDQRGIDEDALARVTERLLAASPAAIAFLGSTGESAYLSDAEWRQVAQRGVEIVDGRVPVILGISELTTRAAIDKARHAKAMGVDMLMIIPISYWKLSDEEIFAHYQAIASATDLPIMVYNNPGTSGVDMSPELLVRLVRELPTIRSIKESSGDLNRMHAIRQLGEGKIPFYNGANHLALEALAAGAAGWCTAAPNLLGDAPARLCALMESGELEKARAHFYRLLPVLQFIVRGGLPATVKDGLKLLGVEAGAPRLPLHPLADEAASRLGSYLEGAGITLRQPEPHR
ncbi:dihydrodipicolinate synthase family protein [Sphingopyxis sp. MWB1]|uniref:dihydrodipicolinate synthase family protein n=1 Tax=Sphingopyxis sp. MWB1 TaxID=1537715 RepID=UPI0006911827|nr:dihydrodipicolinate synthase family protein [Sphingopyxis sp. MWB1]